MREAERANEQDDSRPELRLIARLLRVPREDRRQQLDVERYLIASASSLLVAALFAAGWWLGGLSTQAFLSASALICAFILAFFLLIRSGLNRKFRDAALTVPQIAASIIVVSFVLYDGLPDAAARWFRGYPRDPDTRAPIGSPSADRCIDRERDRG